MLFSTKTPIVKKVMLILLSFFSKILLKFKKIDPGVLEFMLHAEALPYVDNFVRSAKCMWISVNEK